MASIEDEAASGAIVHRAFFVDGYGRDMPAVAFERRPGQSPEVVVYGAQGRSTRAPVNHHVWARVVQEAEYADRLHPTPQTPHPRTHTPNSAHRSARQSLAGTRSSRFSRFNNPRPWLG